MLQSFPSNQALALEHLYRVYYTSPIAVFLPVFDREAKVATSPDPCHGLYDIKQREKILPFLACGAKRRTDSR
jgi:hypothetical protein